MVTVNQEDLLGELIPDVYIRKITLETSGTPNTDSNPHIDHKRESLPSKMQKDSDSLIVTLELLMKEKLDNDLIGTWFANQDLNKYLEIKVFQSTDPKVTAILSAGTDLLELVEPNKNVPVTDLKVKLAATVFEVSNFENVFERLNNETVFKKFKASKAGTGVEPKISQYKEIVDDEGNRVFNITYQQRFELNDSNPEHLAYFAVTSLDLEELAKDFEIDFDSIGLESTNGKIASDIVIDDFKVVNKSFTFLDPQGKIWTGSVHQRDGVFRSNSTETSNSFDLEQVFVSNSKIQDFRDVKEIERLTLNHDKLERIFAKNNLTKVLSNDIIGPTNESNYFSNMLLSRDKDGDAKFFFSIDFNKLIEENAILGNLFASSNMKMKREIIKNAHIRSLRILRRRIVKNKDVNSLGTPDLVRVFDKEEPLELIAISSEKRWKSFNPSKLEMGSIKEIDLTTRTNSELVRHFTGMDLSMSEVTDGLYQYIIELEIDDATVTFLKDKVKELSLAKNVLSLYLGEASQPSMSKYLEEVRNPHIDHPSEFSGTKGTIAGAFDIPSNRFTQNFINEQRRKYAGRMTSSPWISSVVTYVSILDLLTDAFESESSRQKFINSLYSYVSPNTGNPTGISSVINLIDKLISSLSGVAGVSNETTPRRFDGTTKSTLQSPILNPGRGNKRTFKVSKAFNEVFDSNIVKGAGLDYLSSGEDETENDDGLRTIKNENYKFRVDLETLKYYKDPEPNIDLSFGGEQFTEGDSIKATNFSFLSPSRVDFSRKSFILSEGGRKNSSVKTAKDKKQRAIKHIDDIEARKEDVATDILTSILLQSSTGSPIDYRSNEVKSEVKLNQRKIRHKFENYISKQVSTTIKTARTKTVKDVNDDTISLKSIRKVEPLETKNALEEENEDFSKSQDATMQDESFPLNQFYIAISKPMIQKSTPLLDKLSLRELSVVSTSGRPDAVKTIHGLNKVITENQLKSLPNQLKAVFLQTSTQNVLRASKMNSISISNSSDKRKYSASATLDFEMLRKIEYFTGYGKNQEEELLIKERNWKPLTDEANNLLVGNNILCRSIPYEEPSLGIIPNKGLSTIVYDEYFILQPKFREIFESFGEIEINVAVPKETFELGVQGTTVAAPVSIVNEILATDEKTNRFEGEFTSNNIMIQTLFSDAAEEASSNIRESSSAVDALRNRAGDGFIEALGLSEDQALIMLNSIPSNLSTETEVVQFIGQTLEEANLVDSENALNLNVDTVDSRTIRTSISDLIKKSRR